MAIVTKERVKVFLQITGTTKDDLIDSLIPMVEHDYIMIRGKEFNEDSNDIFDYPENSELVSSQMIGFQMSAMMKEGGAFKSESIGDYSYSKESGENMIHGYPKNIVGRIERFIKRR